ncbi:MAG: sigma-70 family RNA polymerase sigma factor [Saprospirales bacterium]|nr:sigma-70 family RNA polymerase sigma factor [Saprospirales bacterium]MBK6901619.1 sigma-70 family RNA polymerase sigma factor [Saprospirales bacterium]MBK7335494.1 sigma-70 family RNA polymerase sigma factor [Saprospirales bacterium]
MEKYQERLYWVVRRLVLDHDDANDVVQNCLIKVYRSIQSFEGKSQLYTWLYRIATNEAITFLNREKRRMSSSIDDESKHLSGKLQADSYFDGDEAQAKLYKAIETLPHKQKLVFNLRYFEEMNYEDMSNVLDTSVGALKASFHHAVKKIENHIRGYEAA